MLHVQHIFPNSFNFLFTWRLSVTVFHSTCIFCLYDMVQYLVTLQFYVCWNVSFVCWYVAPPVSVITTLYYVPKSIFYRRVWYRAISLRYVYIRSWASSSSPRLPLYQISFLCGLHCWASLWKKAHTQSIKHSLWLHTQSLNHSYRLFYALWTKACASEHEVQDTG